MTTKNRIIKAQQDWAVSAGLAPNRKGYLPSYQDNLFQPMNDDTKRAFDHGSGSELKGTHERPAKMSALHSSSALAVNFFDTWVGVDNSMLLDALEIEHSTSCDIRFEEKFSTGLSGNPPNIDVTLTLSDGEIIGIESKFTEWVTAKSPSNMAFRDSYFPVDGSLWEARSLPASQYLAKSLRDNDSRGDTLYYYLNAPQLLKHALGLATNSSKHFRLYYLYFDVDSKEGELHRREIARFASTVGDELKFTAVSYQALLQRLHALGCKKTDYMKYLGTRYCSN